MKKCINPEALGIQERFFEALHHLISNKQISGVQGFCKEHNFNRIKYASIASDLKKPEDERSYKYHIIDIDALAILARKHKVSSDWLLLGVGEMFK